MEVELDEKSSATICDSNNPEGWGIVQVQAVVVPTFYPTTRHRQ